MGYMEQQMGDRKNLKISEETHELLKASKREGETWDGLLQRLVAENSDATVAEIKEALREVLAEEEVIG